MNDCARCGTKGGRDVTHACVSGYGMNLEVERYPGELAKLRRLRERVMALRDKWRRDGLGPVDEWGNGWLYGTRRCAADIDEALKEVGGE